MGSLLDDSVVRKTYEAFVASILRDPEDDVTRHALADFLEELGVEGAHQYHHQGVWELSGAYKGKSWLRWCPSKLYLFPVDDIRCQCVSPLYHKHVFTNAQVRKYGMWLCYRCLNTMTTALKLADRGSL